MSDLPKKPKKPDLPASTLRIMERMVKTPPKPRQKEGARNKRKPKDAPKQRDKKGKPG